jgi:hypothetical protein
VVERDQVADRLLDAVRGVDEHIGDAAGLPVDGDEGDLGGQCGQPAVGETGRGQDRSVEGAAEPPQRPVLQFVRLLGVDQQLACTRRPSAAAVCPG